jgi:hypothetical protein
MSARRYTLLILAVIVTSLVVGSAVDLRGFNVGVPDHLDASLRRVPPQDHRERRWQSMSFERVFTIGDESARDGALLYASTLKVSEDGGIFVVDGAEWLLKEFSSDGKLVARYGHGRGQGPGEFISLTDFDVSRPGEVWVADGHAGRISVFERGGELKRLIKMTLTPYRLVCTGSRTFTILMITGTGVPFRRFDEAGNDLKPLPAFLDGRSDGPFALDGLVASDGTGGYVYVGRYVGLVARYTSAGKLAYLVRTINAKGLPKIAKASNGDRWIDREEIPNAQSVNVSGGKIFILTPIKKALRLTGAIDVYNLADGRYLYSLKPPALTKHAIMTASHAYTVDNISLAMWKHSGFDGSD